MHIQATKVDHNCPRKVFLIAESSAANLHHPDLAVNTLSRTDGYSQDDRIQYPLEMLFDHPSHFDNRLQTTSNSVVDVKLWIPKSAIHVVLALVPTNVTLLG